MLTYSLTQFLNLSFSFFFFFKIVLFIYLAVLCLSCCIGFSLLVVSEGYFLVVVGRLLIVGASLVTEHRLQVSRLQQLWLNCSGA